MSKVHLKRLIGCSEVPKTIIYCDRWDLCARNLVWSNVKSHLREGREIHYLCYTVSIIECSPIAKHDPGEKLKLYDLFTDPLQWNSEHSSSLDAKNSFSNLIRLSQHNSDEKVVVVVDGIDCAAKYLSETEILRDIYALKNAESVLQVILHCSEDICRTPFASALKNLCQSVVTVKSSNPLYCDVLLKKRSGKVLRSSEEFSVSSEFDVEFARQHHPTDGKLSSTQDDSSEISFETTFNLSLTDSQKQAKNKLVLPHTRIQSTGGHIHYVPDAEDDWDDEDPDDDLNI